MTSGSQVGEPWVIAISGIAGSGKSTLGRALARRLRVPMLDLDTLTNPLLDGLGAVLGEHWLSSGHAAEVRDARYAALRATAHEVLQTTDGAVLVAPFTSELQGGEDWRALLDAVGPAALHLVQVVGDPQLFASRRERRGEVRDRHRVDDVGAAPSTARVPVISVDAELTTAQQVALVRQALGLGAPRDVEPPPG